MSRLFEALKRAEQGERFDGSARASAVDDGDATETGLDQYVAERPTVRPIVRERIHAVAPARPPTPDERPARPTDAPVRGHLSSLPEIDAVSIEEYRRLGATLENMQAERSLKCLVVSSACPNEGKTLTTTNLGVTLSDSFKRRVLIVDADLRRPSMHQLFKLPNDIGLSDMLRSKDGDVGPSHVSATLAVLPAGRNHGAPISILSSDRMKEIVADAASRFDWVLIDTPPMGILTDAQLVARVSDGVLFVIAAGMTPYTLVQKTLAELGPDRIVGTVLNRVDPRTLTARDYYSYYYVESGRNEGGS
jgi:capsular exopolysaccharide synthesis family protein